MKWLLKLYPRAWRHRYEEEVLAVLEDHPISPATVIDLLIGAVDANLHYNALTEGVAGLVNRIRASVVMMFCSFILFGLGWGSIQRITDPVNTFQQAASGLPALHVVTRAIFILGFIAFLAFLAGGLPLFAIAIRRAVQQRRRDIVNRGWTAGACLLLFLAATTALEWWHPMVHVIPILVTYLCVFLILLTVGTIAVSQAIGRTDFRASELRYVFVPELVILFGMVAAAALSIVFMMMAVTHAPTLFHSQDVSSPLYLTGIILMSLACLFAVVGARLGLADRHTRTGVA